MNCPLLEEVVLPVFSYTDTNGDNIVVNTEVAMQTPYCFVHRECKNFAKFTLNQKDNNKVMVEKNGILYKVGDNNDYDGYYEIPKTLCAVPYKTESTFILDEDTMAIDNYAIAGNNCITKIVIHSGVTTIRQNTFQNCENLEELHLLGDVTMIDRFALCHCNNLSKIVLMASQAPELGHGDYVPASADTKGNVIAAYYKYHAFGYDPYNWAGYNTKERNILYLPYKAKGYDAEDWILPVFTEDQCSFEIETYTLDDEVVLTVFNQNGEEVTDRPLYLKSDSGEFVYTVDNSVMSVTYDDTKNGYVVDFNNKVYVNEPINVYEDIDCTVLLGTFIAKYGVKSYTVGSPVMSYKSRSLFSTTLFGSSKTTTVDTGDEIVSIKRRDYETLLSRVNQLTEQMNKLKKK